MTDATATLSHDAASSQLNERDLTLICHALHRLATDAKFRAYDAAQDKLGKEYLPGDAEKFLQNAVDAENAQRKIEQMIAALNEASHG